MSCRWIEKINSSLETAVLVLGGGDAPTYPRASPVFSYSS